MQFRTDSKSIALLAIFTSIVIALEVFPILGITDILVLPAPRFTIDWTGIPIVLIFIGLGLVPSLVSVGVMFIAIAYRNFPGAVFKGFAEFFTIVGLLIGYLILRRRDVSKPVRIAIYAIFGIILRSIGMLIMNIPLLPILFPLGYNLDQAIAASIILVPWNVIQAAINIIGGFFIYGLIPKNLAISAGLGEFYETSGPLEELSKDEIDT